MGIKWSDRRGRSGRQIHIEAVTINTGKPEGARGRVSISPDVIKKLGWKLNDYVDIGIDCLKKLVVLKSGGTSKIVKLHGSSAFSVSIPLRVCEAFPKADRKYHGKVKYKVVKKHLHIEYGTPA